MRSWLFRGGPGYGWVIIMREVEDNQEISMQVALRMIKSVYGSILNRSSRLTIIGSALYHG